MNEHMIELKKIDNLSSEGTAFVSLYLVGMPAHREMTLDQIEDLEINLTDIIKQLQDYRLSQICGGD